MAWRRVKKRWLLLAAAAITAAVLVVGAHRMLRNEITAQLVAVFGGDVEIESVSLGISWHEARHVRLRSEAPSQPWLILDKVELELPIFEAVRGRVTPQQIVLTDVEATVRFDKEGQLVEPRWQLQPSRGSRLPNVKITKARVHIEQSDRSTITIDSIDATAESTDDGIALAVDVGESPLGPLSVKADYLLADKTLHGTIACRAFHFDTDALPELLVRPSVPAAPGKNNVGRARGTATANVSFAIDKRRELSYRAELQVSSGELSTDTGGFHLTQVAGNVVVENGVATLSDVRGRLGSGTVVANGELDVGSDGDVGHFNAQLTGMAIPLPQQSPTLLPNLVGVVSGGLNLKLQRDDGKWSLSATGNARLAEAVWDGLPLDVLTASVDVERIQLGSTSDAPGMAGDLQFHFALIDTQLSQLATTFALAEQPFADSVAGSVSLEGQLVVPLQTANDPSSYRADVTVNTDVITIAKTKCGPLVAKATLQQGRVHFDDVVLPVSPSGQMKVSGDIAVAAGDSRLGLVLEQVPVRIVQPYVEQAGELAGDVHGTLALTVPSLAWHDPALWQLDGSARSDELRWGDVALRAISTRVNYGKSAFRLQDVRCEWGAVPFEGDATCQIDAPFAFDVQLRAPRVVLEQLIEATGVAFPMHVAGVGSGTGHVSGSWKSGSSRSGSSKSGSSKSGEWTGTGTATLDGVMLGDVPVSKITLPWKIDSNQLEIADASAALLGGQVQVTAVVPWHDTASSRIDGRFSGWDMKRLSRHLLLKSTSIEGIASGSFSAEHVVSLKQLKAELRFAGVDAVIEDVEYRQLVGRVEFQQGLAQVKLDGSLLGGTCTFQGQSKIDPVDWRPYQVRGKAALSHVRLQNLWSAIGQKQTYGQLFAEGSAELAVQLEELDSPVTAQGTLTLTQVRWGSLPLTRELSAKMSLSENQFRIEDARVRIDQGALVGSATVNPANGRGEFQVRVEQVPLRGLLAFAPRLARGARGKVDGGVSGSLGDRWNVVGVLRLDRGSLAGIPLTAVRLPLRMSRVPDSGRTQLDIELQSARIASGRAKARVQLFWGGRFSIEGTGQVTAADVRPIAKALPGVSDLLGGRVNAKVEVKSANLRSVEDLVGKFEVRIDQGQTLLLPGLNQLTTAVGVSSPGAVTFGETEILGEIQHGIVKLNQMTMESPETRMWVDGQMDLQGTLDFNVAADAGALSAFNLVAATVNPTALLRRRLVFLHLGGSLYNPIVEPRTDQFLAQEVILFFLPVISLR